ncbi:response regulator [Nocardioides plantarum]|uniref:Response regulator n=1 Tax=Nocardioides plantarum TaxID=29299 RepID=A0ABV5K5N9_9ACTN|nr:response regulator [Nocardioides plantarum]
MYALAFGALSCLFGLIFGVPRSRSDFRAEKSERFSSNSNLEDISDWLTKLLVGAGLVQIGRVPDAASALGNYLGAGLNTQNPQAFALTAVTFGVGAGAVLSYLWTRLYLRVLLEGSEARAADASRADKAYASLRLTSGKESPSDLRLLADAAAESTESHRQPFLPILWVDDFPQNNHALVRALRALDIDVHAVTSTSAAIAALRRRNYALVITDLGRIEDGVDNPRAGLDLLLRMRELPIATPVIVFAGPRAVAMESELLNSGARLVTETPSEVFSEAVRYVTGRAAPGGPSVP